MAWMNDYFKAAKAYARDYVLENTGLKVLALLITAVLWLSVASRPVTQLVLSGAPIELSMPKSPNLIPSKYPPLVARITLEGPRDVLDSLRAGQLTITADMSGVEPGVRVIPLEVQPSRLPPNVRVKEIEPLAITVTVERVVEKEVPVVPRFEGEPPQGFEVNDSQIVPRTVKVSGAESQMRDITKVSTESVRLTDRTESFSQTVAIDIGSPNLSISDESSRKVMLTVNIGEARKERVIANVPVAIFGAPARARAIPHFVTVTVYGPRSAVDAISSADVNVGIEYRAGSGVFTPKAAVSPDFADRVVVRSVEPQKVRVK